MANTHSTDYGTEKAAELVRDLRNVFDLRLSDFVERYIANYLTVAHLDGRAHALREMNAARADRQRRTFTPDPITDEFVMREPRLESIASDRGVANIVTGGAL